MKIESNWNTEQAELIAENNGIQRLTEAHWQVINAARGYYLEHNTVADPNTLCHILKKKIGPNEGSMQHINFLFKGSSIKGVNEIAGLV